MSRDKTFGRVRATTLAAAWAVCLTGCATHQLVPSEAGLKRAASSPARLPATTASPHDLPELTAQATLAEYLAYAALNNPELEAAFNRWKAALEKVEQVRTLPDPRFNYGYFIREVETRVGPQRHRLGLSQTFPWFGKLQLRGGVALAEANAAQAEYEVAKLRLFYEVKEVWYELSYLQRALAITADNIQLLKHLESVAQTRFKAGAPMDAVTKAQVELSRLSDRLRTLADLRGPITARLNAALNRAPDTHVPWPEAIEPEAVRIEDGELTVWLTQHSPELKRLGFLVGKEDQALALARKEYYPDLTVGVDYLETGEALMRGTRDSGKDPVMAMVSINLPIWLGKYRAGVEEARARRTAAARTLGNRENLLQAELRLALYRFRDAERKIDLYDATLLPQARGALEVARQSYEAGQAGFLDWIDAQRILLEFQLESERARANREQRLAELELLVGRELPRPAASPPAPARPDKP